MAALKFIGFSGEIPKRMPRILPDMAATRAVNTRLEDGGLQPIRRRRLETSLSGAENHQTIIRYNNDWLSFSGVVHASQGPVDAGRLYYTGDGVPKVIINDITYDLALPLPAASLSTSVSGTPTSDNGETRVYIWTWVTSFGEESEPSPPSDEIYWEPGQTVTLSGFDAVPTGRSITLQRIYRSQVTASGAAEYFFVDERLADTTDYVDSVDRSDIGEVLPSGNWNPPPDGLHGLTALPNGMMAAFDGRILYFCEPYRPHAWPEDYTLSVDYDIVGLGAFGNSVAVLTTGYPYIVSGNQPESMVMQKMELNLPCISERTIQDMGYAVAYATHEGLVLVSDGGARVVTEELFDRTEWQSLNPETMVSGQHEGRYFASYRYVDDSGNERIGTLIFDTTGNQPFVIRSSVRAEAFFYDIETGALYYLLNSAVYEWDARGQVNETQTWRSKLFVLPRPTNFGAILVEADDFLTPGEIEAIENEAEQIIQDNQVLIDGGNVGGAINGSVLNGTSLNGDNLAEVPSVDQSNTVGIYADGELVASVDKVNTMARLPSGFKAHLWQIEVGGNMQVSQITMATTATELMGV